MQSGLHKIVPRRIDSSLLHSYGAAIPDPKSLPENFSIYDGRVIPNQDLPDTRFNPPIRALFFGCTGECQTFSGGLQDNALYPPDDLYDNTPPYVDGEGRDIRDSMNTTITRGYKLPNGSLGAKRTHFYNCYGTGPIDDFDAARIAIWLFQGEKRAVSVGSWWYAEFAVPVNGVLSIPSFNTNMATLHNWIITGWRGDELECIPWQGMNYGDNGKVYMSRAIYNGLMRQPWTGAFTLTKDTATTPVPIGMTVWIDHLVYFIKSLFKNYGLA